MMQEIGNLRFQRAVVPEDAVNLDINTIDAEDASNKMACVAINARFLRRNGTYCQLVLSRSKVVPDGLSQPRAELLAATLNAHICETVKIAFQDNHKGSVKLSDSQVTLHWINNQKKPLKQWARNRVVQINGLTHQPKDWMFMRSDYMIADIGTRRVSDLDIVGKDSVWINGFDWMKWYNASFPAKTIDEIKLNSEGISALENEILK